MKILIVIGTFLILAGATIASSAGVSGAWMVQTGLIFLFGALAVSRKEKIWTQSGLLFMVILFLWGFVNGMWYAHPLGAIISIIGGGWVIYRITRGKEHETGNLHAPLIQEQYIKWVSVPLGILIFLALTKSILIAFVIGFGVVAFLDKQSIKVKGLNRIVILLILYTAGFYFLIVGTYKLTSPYSGIFYNMGDTFFDRKSGEFLQRITP